MEEDADEEMTDKHLLDTGMTCAYDGDVIEYTDLVIVVMIIKPHIVNGQLIFYDMMSEDNSDYLYEPVFFHGKNWDSIEEELESYTKEHPRLEVVGAVLNCAFCKSGILEGETTGVCLTGEIHRSQRNPDLQAYGNHFEPLETSPTIICISCMSDLNDDVQELWPDGVSHHDECRDGTLARCWRSGCPGVCPNNSPE